MNQFISLKNWFNYNRDEKIYKMVYKFKQKIGCTFLKYILIPSKISEDTFFIIEQYRETPIQTRVKIKKIEISFDVYLEDFVVKIKLL